jgi:DNA-binding NarL/FixJ family response regulator
MKRPRVLLADDHTLLLGAFRTMLDAQCDVVGTVTDGRALLDAAPRLKPDVIVLDISMPLLNGLDAGRRLKQTMPDVKLIFLTVNEDPELAAETIRIGASGYLLKRSAASELFRAIEEALAGRTYVTPQANQAVFASLREPKPRKAAGGLTFRQREILQLLAEGCSMKEVAADLNITTRTVAFHKYKLMQEQGLKTNADLIRFAIRHRIVTA